MTIEKYELLNIYGGTTKISAALISSAVRGINLILELGRSVGTVIRRVQTGKLC
jgi:hypothetical protein